MREWKKNQLEATTTLIRKQIRRANSYCIDFLFKKCKLSHTFSRTHGLWKLKFAMTLLLFFIFSPFYVFANQSSSLVIYAFYGFGNSPDRNYVGNITTASGSKIPLDEQVLGTSSSLSDFKVMFQYPAYIYDFPVNWKHFSPLKIVPNSGLSYRNQDIYVHADGNWESRKGFSTQGYTEYKLDDLYNFKIITISFATRFFFSSLYTGLGLYYGAIIGTIKYKHTSYFESSHNNYPDIEKSEKYEKQLNENIANKDIGFYWEIGYNWLLFKDISVDFNIRSEYGFTKLILLNDGTYVTTNNNLIGVGINYYFYEK